MLKILKKIVAKLIILTIVTGFLPGQVFAISTDIFTEVLVKNHTQSGLLQQTASASPGETVMFYVFTRNDGSVDAENLTISLTPHPISGGLLYPGPDVGAYRAYHYNSGGGGTAEYISLADFDLDGSSGGNGDYLMTTALPSGSDDKITFIYVKIPENYASTSFSITATPTCDNGCNITGGVNVATVSVDVNPVVSNVAFNPATVPNDGATMTAITADITDPNNPDNIASVKVNLSSIGGGGAVTMYDDGLSNDGAANDGKYGIGGITTTAPPGTYSSITVTVTDGDGNTDSANATLIVQSAGTPLITLNSNTREVLSNQTGFTGTTLNWQTSQACGTGATQGYRVEVGGTAGTPESGTELVPWDQSCAANTPINTQINNTDINTGLNDIYIYVVNDNGTGYGTLNLEKDLTTPSITIGSYNSTVSTEDALFQWRASENGAWTVRIGGDGTDPTSGFQISGANASGNYTDVNAAGNDLISSTVPNGDLSEGVNTVYVYLTDDGNNVSSASRTITKDTTPKLSSPTAFSLSDKDSTLDSGIDGRDFYVTWIKPFTQHTIDYFKQYDIYLLPEGVQLNTGVHSTGATITDFDTEAWTGSVALTTDGEGNPFATGNYVAWVALMSSDNDYEDADPSSSPPALITAEVPTPPVFQSATFIDDTTLQLTFDANLHTDLSQHTATGVTSVDFTVNTGSGTNGVDSVSGHHIFIKLNPLNNAALTSTDLDINTGAIIGSNNGQVDETLNQNVADGQNPTITFTSPATNAYTNSGVTVSYLINEDAQNGSVKVRFQRTGGSADAQSPYTFVLSGETANTAYDIAMDGENFTSEERGAGDSLVDGAIYSATILAKDSAGNDASNVLNTEITYDISAPSTPVAIHFPNQAGSNGQHTNDATPLLQWFSSTDNTSSSGSLLYNLDLSVFNDFSANTQTFTDITGTSQELGALVTDSVYYWRVGAKDQAENTSGYQSTVESFVFDSNAPVITAPVLTDTDLTNTSYTKNGNNVVLTMTLTDANRDVVTSSLITADLSSLGGGAAVNPATYVGGTGVATWTGITVTCTDGVKNIPIDATDLAGNPAVQVNATITCDNTVPSLAAGTITSPNGSENWEGGSTQNITWTAGDITETNLASLTLEYSDDNGSTWNNITTGEANDGTYSWSPVPSINTAQALVRLIAIDQVTQTGSDVSNATFIIDSTLPTITANTLTAPNGGEHLRGGSTTNITWTSAEITDTYLRANPITLDYHNGTTWVEIANTEANDGTFSWSTIPSLNIANAQVRITAYDAAGNSASDTTNAVFTIDSTLPGISSAETQDLDGNGQIDNIKFTFTENILDSSVTASDFDIAGFTGESFSANTNGDLANDDVIYITVTESGSADSGATPNYTFTQNTLTDFAGNLLATVGVTPTTDSAKPVVVSRLTQDDNGDGQLEGVLVTFSENMDASATTNTDFILQNQASTNLTELYSDTTDDTTLFLGFSDGASFDTGDLTQVQLSGNFQDLAGNTLMTESSFTSATDGAAPIFRAETWIASITPAVKVTFSEEVDSVSDNFADWAVAGFVVTAMDLLDGTTTSTLLSLNTNITDTSITPNVTYTAGDVVDTATNALQTAVVAAADSLAPTVSLIEIHDTDSDGNVETAYIQFSESVDDSTLTVAGFTLGSVTADNFSTEAFGINVADDDRIAISLNTGIQGTEAQDVIYTASVGNLKDFATSPNALANVVTGDVVEQDKAGPALTSATYNDNGTVGDVTDDVITLTFSENLDDTSVDTGVGNSDLEFTVAGGGDITNSTTTSSIANDNTLSINLNAGDIALTVGASTIALINNVLADSDGNTNTHTGAVTINGSVIINEVMWMGTTLDSADEFIELRNMSASAVDISGWTIENAASGSSLTIPALSTIPGNGYFLIANFGMGASRLNIAPNWVTTTLDLADSANGNLVLKDGGVTMDSVKGDTWPTGDSLNKYSMERNLSPGDGLVAGNWHTGDAQLNWDGGATEKGTPGAENVTDAQSPSFQLVAPDSRQPAHNSLYPNRLPYIAVQYADNSGGSGIDTSNVQVFIDLNNDNDYTDPGEDVTALSTITPTQVSYQLGTQLAAGKHSVKVVIQDIAGNSAQTEWSFWLDDLTMTVENAPNINLIAGSASETTTDSEHAKVTITTYGAGITLRGYMDLLASGGNSIQNWDTATGIGWDVKEGAGPFSGTINALGNNPGAATTLVSKSKLADGAFSSQTYTFYVKIYGNVNAIQQAGIYQNDLKFLLDLQY